MSRLANVLLMSSESYPMYFFFVFPPKTRECHRVWLAILLLFVLFNLHSYQKKEKPSNTWNNWPSYNKSTQATQKVSSLITTYVSSSDNHDRPEGKLEFGAIATILRNCHSIFSRRSCCLLFFGGYCFPHAFGVSITYPL